MSYTIGSITPRVRARLNDQSNTVFQDTVLLPYVQDAADELQLSLEHNGMLVLEKQTSTPIVIPQVTNFVPGNVVSMSGLGLLPVDMLEPQVLEERLSGSTDLFVEMTRRAWPPDILPTDSLRYWDYREEDIHFIGATTNRDIIIRYLKRLINVTTINDSIPVNNSQLFIITRTASLAAFFIGEDVDRYNALGKEADAHLEKLIGIGVKSKQGTRTRRRPFVIGGRRRWV